MNFELNKELSSNYHSKTQIARVMTEDWVSRNVYCPVCGNDMLQHFEANRPVADFYCDKCQNQFELKSKETDRNGLGKVINDGQYDKMIQRITSSENPHFLFMQHFDYKVRNLIMIPNHYFVPEIVIKRKPLSKDARRAGWVGCNINIADIPQTGKIFIVKDGILTDKQSVQQCYQKTLFLKKFNLDSKGWLIDVMSCIEKISSSEFTIEQMYSFTSVLQAKHPNNNFVEAKIRQQLQLLRDLGHIKFISRGLYIKL